MKIIDIKEMPNFNPSVPNGIDSVSSGKVYLKDHKDGLHSPYCIRHGAMLKVSPHGIWRCGELGCDNGCFQT